MSVVQAASTAFIFLETKVTSGTAEENIWILTTLTLISVSCIRRRSEFLKGGEVNEHN